MHGFIVYCLWFGFGRNNALAEMHGCMVERMQTKWIDWSIDRSIDQAHTWKGRWERSENTQIHNAKIPKHTGNGNKQQQNSHQIYLNISTIHALQKRFRRRPFTEFHDSTPFNRRSIAVNYILALSFVCECGRTGCKMCSLYYIFRKANQIKNKTERKQMKPIQRRSIRVDLMWRENNKPTNSNSQAISNDACKRV